METPFHTADNLYKFLVNARQMANLDRQIVSKEEELKYLEQLEEIYAKICNPAPFDTARRHSALVLEIMLLKIERNKVERKILEFELGTFLED